MNVTYRELENGDFEEIREVDGKVSTFYRAARSMRRVGDVIEEVDHQGVIISTEPVPADILAQERVAAIVLDLRAQSRELVELTNILAHPEGLPKDVMAAVQERLDRGFIL